MIAQFCGSLDGASHKKNVHNMMEAATGLVGKHWHPHAMLGAENVQALGDAAIVANLHELPCTVVYMAAALHAMDGPLFRIRQSPLPASLGFVFYHYAKTNKSGMQALLDSACHQFQLIVNAPTLKKFGDKRAARDNAVLTTTYIKGITPMNDSSRDVMRTWKGDTSRPSLSATLSLRAGQRMSDCGRATKAQRRGRHS